MEIEEKISREFTGMEAIEGMSERSLSESSLIPSIASILVNFLI